MANFSYKDRVIAE